jgi:hypothetical protein
MTRLESTTETIAKILSGDHYMSTATGERAIQREIALSLAVIADTLVWQVVDEIYERGDR